MINRKLDNALRQTVSDALRNLNYPCYHSSLNVWGNEVIIAYPESPGSDTYKELRGKLETYRVSLWLEFVNTRRRGGCLSRQSNRSALRTISSQPTKNTRRIDEKRDKS